MLTAQRELYRRYRDQHLAYKYPDSPDRGFRITVDPTKVGIKNDIALFDACVVDEGGQINTDTGEYTSPGSLLDTALIGIAMLQIDGVWKLAESETLQTWTGVAGCAVAS